MSKAPRLNYILTPDFHRRLLTKDISNANKIITPNTVANENEPMLTTSTTKILSPLVRFNDTKVIATTLNPVSNFKTYQLDERGVDNTVKYQNLKWSHGSEFIKWVKNRDSTLEYTLKEIDSDANFNINLNNQDLKDKCMTIIEGNDVKKLTEFLVEMEQDDELSLKFILQHLKSDQHEIFQTIAEHIHELNMHSLYNDVLSSLLKLSKNDISYNLFTDLFVDKDTVYNEKFIDDSVSLNIKYDKLTRAKTYIDLLLQQKINPTNIEEYISALSIKLAKLKDKKVTFNVLTSGFEQVIKQNISPVIARSFLQFLTEINEYTTLLSIIDQSSKKDQIHTEILNDLIKNYHVSLMSLKELKTMGRAANFSLFIKRLRTNFARFDECIDNDTLLFAYIKQRNWYSAYDLIRNNYPQDEATHSKVVDIAREAKIPEFVKRLFV